MAPGLSETQHCPNTTNSLSKGIGSSCDLFPRVSVHSALPSEGGNFQYSPPPPPAAPSPLHLRAVGQCGHPYAVNADSGLLQSPVESVVGTKTQRTEQEAWSGSRTSGSPAQTIPCPFTSWPSKQFVTSGPSHESVPCAVEYCG